MTKGIRTVASHCRVWSRARRVDVGGAPIVKELREATPQKLTTGWTSHEGTIKLC